MKIEFTNLYKATKNRSKINKKIIELIKKNQFIGGIQLKDLKKIFQNLLGPNIA